MRPISNTSARLFLFTLTVAFAAPHPACRREDPNTAHRTDGFVAVVGIGDDDPLWPIITGTAARVHANLGLTVPLRIEAPDKGSVNAQIQLLKGLHEQGMIALAVQVTDPQALSNTLESLATRGVRIVTMMRPVPSDTAFIHSGPDEELIGAALADAVADTLKDGGTVALLHADSAGETFACRQRAFLHGIQSTPAVNVILTYDCEANPTAARTIITDTMKRFPRLKGWAVLDNWPLRGHDNTSLLPPTCSMIAVDPVPFTWPYFDNGTLAACVTTEYRQIIDRAVTTAFAMIMGGDRQVPFAAPARTITAGQFQAFKQEWRTWQSPTNAD